MGSHGMPAVSPMSGCLKIKLRQSMGNIAKIHHNKFDPDTRRNDEALVLFV